MKGGIDFGGRPWVAKPQDGWLDWAGNPNFPDYLRVTFVAYGRQRANGHAPLGRGELAVYLVRPTGEVPDRRTVWRAVNNAVKLGYLADESKVLCLVLSRDQSQFGIGDPDQKCRRSHTPKTHPRTTLPKDENGRFRPNDGAERGPSEPNDGAEHRPSEPNVGAEHRRFPGNPSLLLSPLQDAPQSGSVNHPPDADRRTP